MSVSTTGSVPVFQMLSAEQDTVAITSWLLKIVSSGIPIPRMVVCDFSQALLISISKAFAHKRDLHDYMQTCYDIVTGKSKILPETLIRLDVSHLIAMICRWDCLKRHSLPKVRQFFIRAICQVYKMQTLHDIEYLLESILIVAMSQSIGTLDGKNLESQMRYIYVNDIIKGTCTEINEEVQTDLDEVDLETDYHTGWLERTNIIYERASTTVLSCIDGDVLNAFYNIEIASKIKRLMNYLPIWTGVLLPFYKIDSIIATSSSVESEFANLKSRVFKNELPLKVDKFIIYNLDYIEGRIKEASTNYSATKEELKIQKENDNTISITQKVNAEKADAPLNDSHIPHSDTLNKCENWGGLGESNKKKKPNYLDTCSDWDYVQSHKAIEIPILKNGNLCDSMQIDGKFISIKETCAFDSLIQLITHAIGKEYRYKEAVQHLDHPVIKLAISILNRGKISSADYVARAKILLEIDIFEQSTTRYVKFLNANCNVGHLIDILFSQEPSITRIKNCNNCNYIQSRNFSVLHINVDMLIEKGLGTIQEAINDTKFNDKEYAVKCDQCNGTVKRTHSYSPHIFLDTSLITDPNYKSQARSESTLDSLTKSIFLDDQCYTLCGIINYISYGTNYNEGHYIAITFTEMHWYENDDSKK